MRVIVPCYHLRRSVFPLFRLGAVKNAVSIIILSASQNEDTSGFPGFSDTDGVIMGQSVVMHDIPQYGTVVDSSVCSGHTRMKDPEDNTP